jgi:hypothetical protein
VSRLALEGIETEIINRVLAAQFAGPLELFDFEFLDVVLNVFIAGVLDDKSGHGRTNVLSKIFKIILQRLNENLCVCFPDQGKFG